MAKKHKKNQHLNQPQALMKSEKKQYSDYEQLVSDGALNPVSAQLYYPDQLQTNQNHLLERFFQNDFDILRMIPEKNIIIGSIINNRCMTIKSFATLSESDDKPGFKVRMKKRRNAPAKEDQAMIEEIEDWIMETGYRDFEGEEDREDRFADTLEKLAREQLTIDQVGAECRWNRKGELMDFWMLDAATIKRVNKTKSVAMQNPEFEKFKFAQEIDGRVYALYEPKDIVFDFQNKRVDLKANGYGYSYMEQAIAIISSFINAVQYNRNMFTENSVPKGILAFEGSNLTEPQLKELARHWRASFTGPRGQHKIAFLQNKPIWQALVPSNKDLEFNQYIQMMASFLCSIYAIDPAELGLRLNQAQNVLNENQGAKIAFSKDRGLKTLLTFAQNFYNKIISKNKQRGWHNYELYFTGMEERDVEGQQGLDEREIKSWKTINEKRKEKDLPPIEGGEIIADPTYYQNYQRIQMSKDQGDMGGGQGAGGAGDDMGGGAGNGESAAIDKDVGISDDELEAMTSELFKSEDIKRNKKVKVTFTI